MTARRLKRERETIAAMFALYCKKQHGTRTLCPDCRKNLEYCLQKIARCRYGESKPTCKNCVTHCYSPTMQDHVKTVMRYAGPKMLWHHPLLALLHLLHDHKGVGPNYK